MKLLESYSRSCSVIIKDKPKIFEKYFPLPDSLTKYITIQNKSGMSAKDYSYFNEVIDIIKPYLDKENIKIIHLGQDSPPLTHVINLNNQTTIGQSYYLLKKSLCHLSVDSWTVHAACAEEVPCVALYGSTTIENHSPFHFNPEKSIFIESHRNGNKASFAREENPKSIDLILPEKIAEAILKLLGIKYDYPYNTIYIGRSYFNKMVESDCSGVINMSQLPPLPGLIMRMDFNFNLAVLINQLLNTKCSIITNKPIPINILLENRANILEVIYKVEKDNNPNFIKELIENKIKYNMFSELSDEELNAIKLDYLDFNIIHQRKWLTVPDELKNKNLDNIYYKSSKITLSNEGIFASKWAINNKIKMENFFGDIQKLDINKDLSLLWKEAEYITFLEKIS